MEKRERLRAGCSEPLPNLTEQRVSRLCDVAWLPCWLVELEGPALRSDGFLALEGAALVLQSLLVCDESAMVDKGVALACGYVELALFCFCLVPGS